MLLEQNKITGEKKKKYSKRDPITVQSAFFFD